MNTALALGALIALAVALGVARLLDALPLRWLHASFATPPASRSAVVVTGVSSGLGRATARALASQGYLVFGTVRKQADADAVTAEANERFVPLLFDVTDAKRAPAAAKEVAAALKVGAV